MKTIWKFKLDASEQHPDPCYLLPRTIEMPKGAKILFLQTQKGFPCIWALVDPKAVSKKRVFIIYAARQNIHPSELMRMQYIGSFQTDFVDGEELVFHVFEKIIK